MINLSKLFKEFYFYINKSLIFIIICNKIYTINKLCCYKNFYMRWKYHAIIIQCKSSWSENYLRAFPCVFYQSTVYWESYFIAEKTHHDEIKCWRKSYASLFLRLSNPIGTTALLIHVCKRRTCEQACEQGVIFDRVERN